MTPAAVRATPDQPTPALRVLPLLPAIRAAADDPGDGRILGRLLEQRAHIPRPTCGPSRPSVCCWASAVCN